jgi:hypothetical protein
MSRRDSPVGRLVGAIGGVVLVFGLFRPWYSINLGPLLDRAANQLPPQLSSLGGYFRSGAALLNQLGPININGWHAVHTIRLVVLVVGVGAVVLAIAELTPNRGVALVGGGLVAAALVGYRIGSPPWAGSVDVGSLLHVESGAWISLAGSAIVILAGGIEHANERAMTVPTWTAQPPLGPMGPHAPAAAVPVAPMSPVSPVAGSSQAPPGFGG